MVGNMQKYLLEVVRINIMYTGFLSSVPFLVMWITSMISGLIADILIGRNLMSITKVRIMFTALAGFGPAVFTMTASYAECEIWAIVLSFSLSLGFMGAYYAGMKISMKTKVVV